MPSTTYKKKPSTVEWFKIVSGTTYWLKKTGDVWSSGSYAMAPSGAENSTANEWGTAYDNAISGGHVPDFPK
jgi:predicted component of type VI protein secretion system